jgi:hypothetical protein
MLGCYEVRAGQARDKLGASVRGDVGPKIPCSIFSSMNILKFKAAPHLRGVGDSEIVEWRLICCRSS